MSEFESNNRLKLITWNVERASINRFEKQLASIKQRTPDIVALQEVGVNVSRRPHQLLREFGFKYTAHSHDFRFDDPGNSSGCAFASRWPFRVLPPETFEMPYKHQALSAEFFTPFGRIEGYTVHVLPGSQFGEIKTEMFDAIYDRLAEENPSGYRFLCGDFNSPKEEGTDGEVTVWGSDEDWISSERSVMVDLADYDLTDAFRDVNGYGDGAYSWVAKNRGNEFPRRFDHVFASEELNATEASYLHEYDDLSDHTPLEAVFTPKEGLYEDVKEIERSAYTPTDEIGGSPNLSASHNGLNYDDDVRMTDPDANYRRGRFKVGWNKAVDGAKMDGDVLEQLTWENLGWRLGRLFGSTSEELQEEVYEWCVKQQVE